MLARGSSYDEMMASFRWNVPVTYNMADAACDAWARREPERIALLERLADGTVREWSYARLSSASRRLANVLVHNGIRRGDRVGVLLPQSASALIAHFAAYRMGAIALPMALQFGVEALSWRLADAGVRVVITTKGGSERLAQIRGRLPNLDLVLSIDGASEGALGLDAEMDRASDRFETVPSSADDPALMIYTSGTTGPPKGALHGHRVLLGHVPGVQFVQGFMPEAGDRMWTPSDWAWAGGLLNATLPALVLGVPVVASRFEKFDPEEALSLMAQMHVRNVFFAPTALKMLRAVPNPRARFDLNLRTIGAAGEALGSET
jgi:acetyl-CoA synthetase